MWLWGSRGDALCQRRFGKSERIDLSGQVHKKTRSDDQAPHSGCHETIDRKKEREGNK
jgi:hypothetical protein